MDTAGSVGVTMFFSLSGFLITSLLLEEQAAASRIRWVAFYGRRARRLFPALAVVVAVVALIWVVWPGVVAVSVLIGAVTYSTNWVYVDGHLQFGGGALAHTWSLAIEEQFYLLWPLVLIACRRVPRRWMAVSTLTVCAAVLAWRAVLLANGASMYRLYFGSDTRADNLLLGCALAFALHGARRFGASVAVAPAALAVIVTATFVKDSTAIFVWLPTVVTLAACSVIYAGVSDRGVPWLAWRPLVLLGQRSYGLYLWHVPVGVVVTELLGPSTSIAWTVTVPLAWGLTCLSWRYVEQPILNRRPSVEKVLDREHPGQSARVAPLKGSGAAAGGAPPLHLDRH
jgi:peptidoglycan/LPS O-acetylase OafA/YrhL